jgi:hypothetical protein
MEHNKLLLEAIALQKCVMATYNRMAVKLAPHILYTRHDELFVDAVTLERDGRRPKEMKLGAFKLAGLKDLELVAHNFAPAAFFNPADSRYAGEPAQVPGQAGPIRSTLTRSG